VAKGSSLVATNREANMSDDALDTWLDFNDLQQAKIVPNRETLKEWQNDSRINFPKGRLFGPNSRRWSKEREIEPWLESRPVEREQFGPPPTKEPRRANKSRKELAV
jgi:hypothetical protein